MVLLEGGAAASTQGWPRAAPCECHSNGLMLPQPCRPCHAPESAPQPSTGQSHHAVPSPELHVSIVLPVRRKNTELLFSKPCPLAKKQ